MTEPSDGLPVLVIDGARFSDLDGFTREFSRLLVNYTWRGNLDALNDLLRGGFGTPENGWVLRWLNSELSRSALGYRATIHRLEQLLLTCHPSQRENVENRIRRARRGQDRG
jgi:RNAse (barnase) inhibitor barstar